MKIVNSTPNVLKDKLDIAIQKAVADYMADYKLNNPNFSRKRVLTMDKVIKLLLSMQGGSLKKELYDAGLRLPPPHLYNSVTKSLGRFLRKSLSILITCARIPKPIKAIRC